jgi:hypothetical protein
LVNILLLQLSSKESRDTRMVELSIIGNIQNPQMYSYGHLVIDYNLMSDQNTIVATPKPENTQAAQFKFKLLGNGTSISQSVAHGKLTAPKLNCIYKLF